MQKDEYENLKVVFQGERSEREIAKRIGSTDAEFQSTNS
jgi:hypothetical protein